MKRYEITRYYDCKTIRSESWFDSKGELHRTRDKPAVIDYGRDGRITNEQWYKHGKEHRGNDKPARIGYEYTKRVTKIYRYWYVNGEMHRENGPAATTWKNSPFPDMYYLCDERIETEEEYNNIISIGKQIKLDSNLAILYIKNPIKYLRVLSKERLDNG